MSGHSRWAGIKHKKAIIDSKRGKTFTKLIREITVAARQGGGNPENNPRLRKAIEDAREANMPHDNMQKAIQRGTGELPGIIYEEIRYEGYGPGGVAVMVEVATDNKNRTASEIRKIFSEYGGNMAESGSVSWMFSARGYITVDKKKSDEESLMALALELGAEDLKSDDKDAFEIFTSPKDFEKVRSGLLSRGIPLTFAEIIQSPQTTVHLEGKEAENVLAMVRTLEDHDEVNSVHSNFDIPQEILEKV